MKAECSSCTCALELLKHVGDPFPLDNSCNDVFDTFQVAPSNIKDPAKGEGLWTPFEKEILKDGEIMNNFGSRSDERRF